jgi:hypothetical protein
MKNSVENHLRPIINNVVDNYPYYNRSFGHDHFLVYPYDFGVLCSGRHLREDWSEIDNCPIDETVGHKYFCHVSRIINTSFIGNYGMDAKYYKDNDFTYGLNKCIGSCPKVICHRPHVDIVTPQYLTANTHECYSDLVHNKSLYVKRDFDSCFKGNYRYQRSILELMKKDDKLHYRYNHSERYRETDDLQKCIFAYHMCGQACWSQRLYDALALGAIPIIVADGAIQAFERFLDWRKFTIKISVAELYQDRLTYRFRRNLRKQADLFRQGIKYSVSEGFLPEDDTNPKALEGKGNTKTGFVLKKMVDARASVEWFNFRDLRLEVNAFRMLVLEMFCRIVRHKKSSMTIDENLLEAFSQINSSDLAGNEMFQFYVCSRKSDFTARLRYMQ